ncbi:MAG: autotransporter-associated beta strand repeat-containing protein [Bacteroidales bacterium]|nr:autotransporter-associated beta strand repeat-containing protein [Bacteroidales bacterium]
MKKLFVILLSMVAITPVTAQRITDKLDRGLVAVPANSGGGNLVSWRVFGEEYYDVTYNLYCDGSPIATNLEVSNYQHTAGTQSSSYQVAAVVRGVEQPKSAAITRWNDGFLEVPVQKITGRDGTDVTSHYTLNDVSMGDLDGDGVVEFIVKRPCDLAADVSNKNCFHVLDCYRLDGTRLWWIDLGPNMLSGADEQWDAVCFDWDQDGKAEVLLRIQDNAILHYADGSADTIGSMAVDTRWSGIEYTSSGNEYLLYLEGVTGKPYEIGEASHPKYLTYPIARGSDSDWGSGIVGHRSTKHYWAAPYLDGRHASIFLGRGCYTKHVMKAFDVDPATHKLIPLWTWQCSTSGMWFGQGYHNFQVADVDWDGRDEIVFGSMIIDDNGKGLSTTGLGHGDSQHCSDFDPYRKYQEMFACNESSPANNYRNACTSEIYYRQTASGDDGRALMGNFTNDYPGSVGRSVASGWVSSTSDKIISELNGDALISWGDLNSRIYYDGDLLDEYLESPGTEGYGVVYKPGGGRVANLQKNAYDTKMNNYTKNNPGAQGDIFGDWREEVVLRTADNTALRVYTTGYSTKYRIPTLWHDHQYRNAMVWQSMGYNQCPHKSYFLGELEGITTAPAPLTMTGRTEIANGGTVTTTDEHLIVCENNNTEISIQEGASPYIVTFNVPSWVQGKAGDNATTKTAITYQYYTCNVTGGGLSGSTRLIKQGDGILNLPSVNMTHTGETNVWAGTVNYSGEMKNSPLWLNRFAEFNGSATFKSLKADYGSVVRPGGKGQIGTVRTVEGYTMGFGSRLVLELSATETDTLADKIAASQLTIESKSWSYGPKYLVPVIELATPDGSELQPGDYVIGEFAAVSGSLANIKIEGAGKLKTGLKFEKGKLILSLGNVRGASHIVWTGQTSAVWDYASTPNFMLDGDETASPDIFVTGDIVDFTDASPVRNISIKDEMTVDTMRVNSTQAYTFAGNGKIVGGAFVKEGSGTVTMSNDNTYTGGNYLRGGTTIVSSLASATQAYGGLGAAVATPAKFQMSNGAVLQTSGTIQNNSPMYISTEAGGVINNSGSFTQQRPVQGTLLTKRGSGTLTLSVDNSVLQKLVISGGSVYASTGTPAKAIEITSGSLTLAAASGVPITVPADKTASIYCQGDRLAYSSPLYGAGTVTIYYPVVIGSGWNATRTALNGNWSEFEGTIRPAVYTTSDGRFCLNNGYGLAKGTLNIPEGIVVESTARTFALGELIGAGSLGGVCSLSSSSPGNWSTWNVGGKRTSFSFSGQVTSNAILNKVGEGTMTVSGAWDNTGTVTVREGTLKVSTTASLGSGNLIVSQGARLFGNLSTGVIKNANVTINGTLQPGLTETIALGKLLFNGQNVSVSSTGTLRFGISKASTGASVLSGTSIQNIGTLTFASGSVISVFLTGSYVPKEGDEIRLFSNVSAITGTPVVEIEGYEVQTDMSRFESEGVIVILTAVSGLERIGADDTAKDVYYDLVGRRVSDPGKGVYILNGKKVIIK